MDNTDSNKPAHSGNTNDEPGNISHSPLDLGGSRPIEVNKVPKPQPRPVAAPVVNIPKTSTVQSVPTGKITGVKTIYTKLHAGSLDFLDGLINDWIRENPTKEIKMVQTTVGELQGKKTEPNIIVVIWF